MSNAQRTRDSGGHGHGHGPGHGHNHHHGHSHSHSHESGHATDHWSGEEYLSRPGVKETGKISFDTIIYALTSAGLLEAEIRQMDVLEVGCVTAHLLPFFSTVHSLDLSPSMLLAIPKSLASVDPPLTSEILARHSFSLHALGPASAKTFAIGTPLLSPTPENPERTLPPPRKRFDLIVANLVVHHVDDIPGFMAGLTGLLSPGGWVVFTEFGKVEASAAEDVSDRLSDSSTVVSGEGKTTEGGSVNAPNHYHPAFTVSSISELLVTYGLVDVHAEIKGSLPVFGLENPPVPCLFVRGRKQ